MCIRFVKDINQAHQMQESNLSQTVVQPVVELLQVTRRFFVDHLLTEYNITTINKGANPMDSTLTLTSKAELDRLGPELVYPASWYIAELWDCEDYALQGQLDAGRKFKFSARMCTGWMEGGYHGFLLTLDTRLQPWVLENNAGFPWAGVWHKPVFTDSPTLKSEHYWPQAVFI